MILPRLVCFFCLCLFTAWPLSGADPKIPAAFLGTFYVEFDESGVHKEIQVGVEKNGKGYFAWAMITWQPGAAVDLEGTPQPVPGSSNSIKLSFTDGFENEGEALLTLDRSKNNLTLKTKITQFVEGRGVRQHGEYHLKRKLEKK